MLFAGTDIPGSDVDVVTAEEVDLPPAFFLVPFDNSGLLPIAFRVLFEAADDNSGPWRDKLMAWVFTYRVDPVLLFPSFVASWNNVILVGYLANLPDFEFIEVFERFIDLTEGVEPSSSANG